MLTYEEARSFIEETSRRGSVLGLDNMYALMDALGNPQDSIRVVHIAGTNGKGSVGAYLASILKEAGLKVGRYCSPAVFDPLECWQYDARNITKEEYACYLSQVKNACDIVALQRIEPTAFEVETALAFVYAKAMNVDILLLETGLGGATDATNVIKHPIACIFTTISRDHMQFLGETLKEIAKVKSGIIKSDTIVVSAVQQPEVRSVLAEVVRERIKQDANIIYVREDSQKIISQQPTALCFAYEGIEYTTHLSGIYQMQNAALAIEAANVVFSYIAQNVTLFSEEILDTINSKSKVAICQKGIENTRWPGRFEVLGKAPYFIIDGAHNEDAVRQLAITIEKSFTNASITFIIGILADKEHEKMLEIMMPFANRIYTITPPNPRGLSGRVLAEEVRKWHDDVCFCASIEEAVQKAIVYGKESNSPIIAFGSLSYLGQLKEYYKQICESRMRDV